MARSVGDLLPGAMGPSYPQKPRRGFAIGQPGRQGASGRSHLDLIFVKPGPEIRAHMLVGSKRRLSSRSSAEEVVMNRRRRASRLMAVLAMLALAAPATAELAFAQGPGRGDGAQQARGGGGGGERARGGGGGERARGGGGGGGGERGRGGGGGARPEVRSQPSEPRFSPPPRMPSVERREFRRPEAPPRPQFRDFSRQPPSEFRRLPPPEARRPAPERRIEPRTYRPPVAVERRPPPGVRRAHRPWRPGLRWRYVYVPTYIIAQDLEWCHYHRWPARGMVFHRDVRCHVHAQWNHPSLRYVEAY